MREERHQSTGLHGHLEDCLAQEGGSCKGEEGDAKVPTGEACQVKEGVGEGGCQQHCPEAIALDALIHPHLGAL